MQNKSTCRAMAARLQSDRMTVYFTYDRRAVNLTRDSDPFGVNNF
jgi:hypothetical protein